MKVVDSKAIAKEHGLRGYSKLRKTELITFLQNNLRPTPWEPIDDRPRPPSAPCTRPPKPTRPPPTSTWTTRIAETSKTLPAKT